jgi:hypothetical protein
MNKKGQIYLAVTLAILIGLGFYFLSRLPKDPTEAQANINETSNRPADLPETAPANSVPVEGVEECSVSSQSLGPALNINSADVNQVVKSELLQDEKKFYQKLLLKDGMQYEYNEGGCVHFAYAIVISPFSYKGIDKSLWISEALKLIRRNVFTEEGRDKMKTFIAGLEEAEKSPTAPDENGMNLPCGDAHCELRLAHKKLTLSYDMAL